MATNGSTSGRCASFINGAGNASLLGVRNHGSELSILILNK